MAGHATPDVSYRSGGHRDPIGIRGASRPASRGACPAPPGGRPGAVESAVSHTGPSAVAVLAQGVAAVEERAAAGSPSHRRPLASRSVRSALVAAFAASGKTAHRFAGSRSDSALGRRKPSLGCAAHPQRVTEAGNCRLGTHGVALPAWAADDTIADMAHIPGESPRPGCRHLGAPVTDESGDDVVDVLAGAWRESAEPHWRCASPQCSVIDWPASGSTLKYQGRFRPRSPSPPHGHAEEHRPQPATGCPFDAPRAVLRPC